MTNPLKSRKFVYALAGLIAALVLALLPTVTARIGVALEPKTLELITYLVPKVVLGTALVIGGHVLSDETSKILGYQVKPLRDAVVEMWDAASELLPGELIPEYAPPIGSTKIEIKLEEAGPNIPSDEGIK